MNIRLSHRDLEKARKNPTAFLENEFRRWGRLAYWKHGVKVFHENGQDVAVGYIVDKYEEKFNHNPRELERFIRYLESYARSFEMLGNETLETKCRISYNIGYGNTLSGEVDRVDRSPEGKIEVYLYELSPDSSIESQLRFPVMKQIFAEKYGYTVNEVEVGIFDVDLGQHILFEYSLEEVKMALKELRSISKLLSLN